MKSEPRMAEDGRLWTPGAVDFFRTVNEQVRYLHTQQLSAAHRASTLTLSRSFYTDQIS